MRALESVRDQVASGFSSLKGSPRDLFIIFVLKVLESYNYFSLSRIFVLYLTENFGVDDLTAGTLYGLWGTLLVLYGFILGGAIDFLGVKRSLVLCFVLNITSRLVMASTSSRLVLLVALLGPNTVAGSLGVPVMTIGVKRYTHSGNRGFAFSLFYTLMNVAALTQGVLMDFFRIRWKHGFDVPAFADRSLLNSGNRLFLASGCVTSMVGLWLTFLLSDPAADDDAAVYARVPAVLEAEAGLAQAGPGERPRSVEPAAKDAPSALSESKWQKLVTAAGNVALSREFIKYIVMCVITVNLKSVFKYLDAMLPKYQLRAFGCDAPIGMIYSINPFTIVFLVPIIGAMTTGFQHFDMIHFGSYLSALSPFWLVIWPAEWAAAMFVLTLSLGEAVWSPRWYDYSMGVAPDGKEGMFTALASAPLFAAMLPTGMLSGYLLDRFCPDNGQCSDVSAGRSLLAHAQATAPSPSLGGGECRGPIMWTTVALLTLTSQLLILVTQKWIRPAPSADKVQDRTPGLGTGVDFNEADPLLVVDNLYQSAAMPRHGEGR